MKLRILAIIQEEVESEESVVILCPLLRFVWGAAARGRWRTVIGMTGASCVT
jgi:hypothetical protein